MWQLILIHVQVRKTGAWHTIARALGMSQSTVINRIDSLVQRQLIDKESTTRHSKSGKVSTANNHYHLRSVADAKVAHERFPGHVKLGGTLTDEEDM